MIKVAYGSVPKDSGTYTFYRNQRPLLLSKGVDLRCVSVGAQECGLIDADYVDEGCVQIAPNSANLKAQSRAFSDWCVQEDVDIVIGINSVPILSSFPHLPQNIRVMARCANGFDHGYKITMSGAERSAGIVALTPKLRNDLINQYAAPDHLIELIPNGIDPEPFDRAISRDRSPSDHLNICFLGRLEHAQKGVMYIPGIVEGLERRNVNYRLKIAGRGRHEEHLRKALEPYSKQGTVEFVGRLSPEQVPEYLLSHDALLFTSQFEGCPNTLLEALMAGCVPASWLIEGTTDFLVRDGETGLLAEMGDVEAMASSLAKLGEDRSLLNRMSQKCKEEARAEFSNTVSSGRYADLFHAVMQNPVPQWVEKRWSEFSPDPNFPRTWKRFIPSGLKETLRRIKAPRATG